MSLVSGPFTFKPFRSVFAHACCTVLRHSSMRTFALLALSHYSILPFSCLLCFFLLRLLCATTFSSHRPTTHPHKKDDYLKNLWRILCCRVFPVYYDYVFFYIPKQGNYIFLKMVFLKIQCLTYVRCTVTIPCIVLLKKFRCFFTETRKVWKLKFEMLKKMRI